MTTVRITILRTGEAREIFCELGESILNASVRASRAGDELIPVGCQRGGCGLCRIRILSGDFVSGQMSAAQISDSDRSRGEVLACRTYPRGELRIEPLGLKGQQAEMTGRWAAC
jgi:ferredoxin